MRIVEVTWEDTERNAEMTVEERFAAIHARIDLLVAERDAALAREKALRIIVDEIREEADKSIRWHQGGMRVATNTSMFPQLSTAYRVIRVITALDPEPTRHTYIGNHHASACEGCEIEAQEG